MLQIYLSRCEQALCGESESLNRGREGCWELDTSNVVPPSTHAHDVSLYVYIKAGEKEWHFCVKRPSLMWCAKGVKFGKEWEVRIRIQKFLRKQRKEKRAKRNPSKRSPWRPGNERQNYKERKGRALKSLVTQSSREQKVPGSSPRGDKSHDDYKNQQ